ncbi:ABC transporter ATP-binding protein [Pseudomonas sp. P1B16]|jgi:putative spermidine/putrescine transport system ATP-binding protein|uniref:ABC transporter ATP-binding protein n=1 Tax=Pseudomonas capeferrum TaxID=1495066 RepID=A0ABY7R3U1_9PSED|nr:MULTISPECIES: ABC transporter ATP-binding protein [Pseudomonas]KEY89246.1 branched-chain amino acid ABC transporter substrate-binding protein [Pseudomonas capeferrum]KGI95256.1 branched-chain amino acid ABC transporter substrate-binding protein [Pseudomonas sp. H2]MCH7301428.1 ABC transporter ATP-binding protein [Pseudomonas capeferrum]MDD1961062.1 ABC transporter ATP-binding protein [Pseudomonas sp. 39004]MDD2063296.1 ABC transporter ATP-binding protein [Pseudomonas sp. 25571]
MSAVIKDNAHTKTLVSLRGLNKHYGDFTAVDNLDLEIQDGEFLTFLGSSGSGKSTTLSMLAGFETPSSGEILVEGQSLVNVPPHKRDIGMVFQRYSLFPHLNVRDNIAFPLAIRKLGSAEINKRVDAMLKLVQLEKFAHRKPSQMSGGQQQRVAIARALVYEPRILLMDEPLGALDKKLREDLQDELRQLHRRLGITIVYVTHDQEEAMRLSQRIAIFSHGKIVGLGSGYDLYQNPPNAFVASFLGNSNFLRIKASSNGAGSFEGQPVAIRLTAGLAAGQEALIMVRPEKALALTTAQAAAQPLPPGWNEVAAKVAEVLFLGESQTCHVVTAGGTEMTVKALSAAGMPMQPGDTVNVRWAVADACIYTEWAESDLSKSAGAH